MKFNIIFKLMSLNYSFVKIYGIYRGINKMEVNNKHAYLIMAHQNFEQLAILLELLDDIRNDIFIHVDKK